MEPPTENLSDKLHKVITTGIGMYPAWWSPLVGHLFGVILPPSIEARNQEFWNDVCAQLHEHSEARGINWENLPKDPAFVDTILTIVQSVPRTSETKKLTAYKNAVLNMGLGDKPESTRRQLYLALLGRYTALHLTLLHFASNSAKWFDDHQQSRPKSFMTSMSAVILAAFPEWKSESEMIKFVWNELKSDGLHDTDSSGTVGIESLLRKHTTNFGDGFIKFINFHGAEG